MLRGWGGAQNGMEELQLLQELQFWTEVSPEQSPGAGGNQARQTPWGKETRELWRWSLPGEQKQTAPRINWLGRRGPDHTGTTHPITFLERGEHKSGQSSVT